MTIKHIEDLPLDTFFSLLEDPTQYIATEKVDGSQLLFGFDEIGFYTSRETKGGQRIYDVNDYEIEFANIFKRAAHVALQNSIPKLLGAGMKPGDQVEIEVLYGETPNVVRYSKDKNYLIFLRTTEGSVNIDRLGQEFADYSLGVSLLTPFTDDGHLIDEKMLGTLWEFSTVPEVKIDLSPVQQCINDEVDSLKEYLAAESSLPGYTNAALFGLNLTSIPKSTRQEVREAREEVRRVVKTSVADIKVLILECTTRCMPSKFGLDDSWVEGIVLTHKQTRDMVKLVDKSVFGAVRIFSWEVRNQLYDLPVKTKQNLFVLLDKYINERDEKLHYDSRLGKSFQYKGDIDRRTLEVFASLIKQAE